MKNQRRIAFHREDPVDHSLVAVHDHAVLVSRIDAENVPVAFECAHDRFGPGEVCFGVCLAVVLVSAELVEVDEEQSNHGSDDGSRCPSHGCEEESCRGEDNEE